MYIETHPCVLKFLNTEKENKTACQAYNDLSVSGWWETIKDLFYLSHIKNTEPKACFHVWV